MLTGMLKCSPHLLSRFTLRAICRLSIRFGFNQRGNVAVIFALTLVPLISAVGAAVDFTKAMNLRSKLIGAADTASVGSVAWTSRAFTAAGSMSGSGPIPGGNADALALFEANKGSRIPHTLKSLRINVAKQGDVVSSRIEFEATMPTDFLGIVGLSNITVTGASEATATMPRYVDFYLLLDNSPSMGVGATPADVSTMVRNTADKCAFACHDTSNPKNYYKLAKALGVTTRIDVLRSATQELMDTAAKMQTYSNQFRMAIYDFGGSASTSGLRTLFPLSSSLSAAKTAAQTIDLMTVASQNENNDQDSPFSTILPSVNLAISTPGDGGSSSPLKYLFLVSDGVADEYNPGGCLKRTTAGRCQSPINPSLCSTLKSRGIKIAALYTTYLALPTNDWYNTWISPFNAGPYGPSVNSEIARNMQACASPGFYFEVSPTEGIADAMKVLFQRAVADARVAK